MEEQIEKDSLYFPQGIKREREYFEGYGKNELVYTIIATICAGIVAFIVFQITKSQIKAIFLFLAVPTTAVLFVVRNDCNVSVVSQIRFMIRFAQSQKKYPYIAKKEW
ncbi:hypothetical protein [Anaeromicropila herbilytica]|uniref:PrgI family protein n=1 Tax=Anaeromicropila herbilytica TaxID=2785025 RepID=A0A7R7ID05_9FIRM|nr:hypothetical protein [Anaeromicropila herbilytica]BCN29528.1 hypothetical protein bsdtb5_08230 [Anaeromicropila herbilytica]